MDFVTEFCFCFAFFFYFYFYQRWLLTIRLRQAFWNLTWRIRWPILCSGSTGIKPRNPTFDPWLTLGRQSPVQVGCLPTLIMVMQGPTGCCSLYQSHSLLLHLVSLFFFLTLLISSFLKFICHGHFIMTLFIQLGRLAVLLERFQQLSETANAKMSCLLPIHLFWLSEVGNNATMKQLYTWDESANP